MTQDSIPFHVTDWTAIDQTEPPGQTGSAFWRTLQLPDLRLRMVATMKRLLLFLLALAVWCDSGCNQSTESNAKEVFVSIEVESAFQNDFVTLLLDSKTLLESRITTNYTVDLAWSTGLQKLSNDSHTLYFAVAEFGAHNTYQIDLANDTSSVTINFDRATKQIRFFQYKGILLRD
jgi:hypothetical protein